MTLAGVMSSCVANGELVTQQLFADARSRQERRSVPTATGTPTPALPTPTTTSTRTPPPGRTFARVVRVWDGNTVLIEGGYSVRYIGVAAPGAGMFRRPVEPFGREAAERNIELVEGREVELEADETDLDAAGNMLRYVYVGGAMVNQTLLREGLARLAPFGRNTRHASVLTVAEAEARRSPLNIWTLATPTPLPTNTPTITPTPAPTFTPSPSPVATATPRESPTPRPPPTSRATPTAVRAGTAAPAAAPVITLIPVPPQPVVTPAREIMEQVADE
jgi:endonuclease YncB( thermonuclease family)